MKLVKYSKSGSGKPAGGAGSGSAGSSSTASVSSGTVSLDRTMWGQYDDGDDVDGSMTVHGDVYIREIAEKNYDPDDDGDDGEDIDEETGGGNLTVEGKITADDVEAGDVTVSGHLYVRPGHPAHSGEKKCLVEAVEKNSTEIGGLKTAVQANAADISTNKTEINSLKTKVQTNTTNISNLTGRVEKLESRKNPGYYWSAEAQLDGNQPVKPIEPLTYIGADIGTFEVTENQAFLWRTIDGETFSVVSYWIPPEADKYYVASTYLGTYIMTGGKSYHFPGGFICYYNAVGSIIRPYGVSNWTPYTSYLYQSSGHAAPVLNYPVTGGVCAGSIPRVEGYPYIFSVDSPADINDYTKWTLVQSSGSGSTSFLHAVEYADWGNSSTAPGYFMYEVSIYSNVVAQDYLGKNSSDPFITGPGTKSNWGNATWRKSFLMQILSQFLYDNRGFYNENVGWSFNWNGAASSTGYGGQWTCRMGGVNAPNSDNSGDIGYYSTSSIPYLTGYVYGDTSSTSFRVDFVFLDITLGHRTDYKLLGASAGGTIDPTGTKYKHWNCEFGSCRYKITDI